MHFLGNNFCLLIFTFLLFSCGDSEVGDIDTNTNVIANLKWNFNKKKEYKYSYRQEIQMDYVMEGFGPLSESKSSSTALGELQVLVNNDYTADIIISKMKLTSISYDLDGNIKDTSTFDAPDQTEKGMQQDGSFPTDNANYLFKILFPIPTEILKTNDQDEIPLNIPFNAHGTLIPVTGNNTLTLLGETELLNRKCVVLSGEITVNDFEIPEELEGDYSLSNVGTATYYFDLKEKCFVGADITFNMEYIMDDAGPMQNYTSIKSQNKFEIRLVNIIE